MINVIKPTYVTLGQVVNSDMINKRDLSSTQKISFDCIAVFAAVFLLSSAIAHSLNPRDKYFASFPVWDIKYNYLVNTPYQVDLMAIGNSHIYRHFSPSVFENKMKLHGRTINALNMGVPNLSIVELPLVLDAIKNHLPKPGYILVDPFVGTGSAENWFTVREIKNHDFNNFIHLSLFDIDPSSKLSKSLIRASYHFLSFLGNAFNVGMLNSIVYQDQDNYINSNERAPNMAKDKGFIAIDFDNVQSSHIPSTRIYSSVNKNLKKQVAFNPNYIDFFEEINERILAMGSIPIFVANPTMSFKEAVRRNAMIKAYLVRQPNAVFLDYSMLFIENESRTNDIWFDGGHLTLKGATIFSEQLASDLSKIIE